MYNIGNLTRIVNVFRVFTTSGNVTFCGCRRWKLLFQDIDMSGVERVYT